MEAVAERFPVIIAVSGDKEFKTCEALCGHVLSRKDVPPDVEQRHN